MNWAEPEKWFNAGSKGSRRGAEFAEKLCVLCVSAWEDEAMSGIQYVADEKGRKVAVQIDLKLHRELWEVSRTFSFPARGATKDEFLSQ